MAGILCVCVSEALRIAEFFSRSDALNGTSLAHDKAAINGMQLADKACSKHRLCLLIEAAQRETGPETVGHDVITCGNVRYRAGFCNVALQHDQNV